MARERYECPECGLRLPFEFPLFKCPRCGSPLLIAYDLDAAREAMGHAGRGNRGVWQFESLLPSVSVKVSLGEGGTPLRRARRLGAELGLKNLLIKDETRNPTGSFIDRGSTVLLSLIRDRGYRATVVTRGGNLAASVAAYASAAGVECYVASLRPYDIVKVYQVVAYGGKLLEPPPVSGTYEVEPGDPALIEGYKTMALELLQQERIDAIVMPVGSGTLMTSVWKAARELQELGALEEVPRLYGVQSAAWDPIVGALRGREPPSGEPPNDAIASDLVFRSPPRARDAVRAIVESGGSAISVLEHEILCGLELLARSEGILAEPSAAVAVSGLAKLVENGEVGSSEVVVLVVTGSGLKAVSAVAKRLLKGFVLSSEAPSRGLGRTKREILRVVAALGEVHGYELWRILSRSGLSLSKAAVYKHLADLERMGLLRRRAQGRAVKYLLTRDGALALQAIEVD